MHATEDFITGIIIDFFQIVPIVVISMIALIIFIIVIEAAAFQNPQ